MELKNNYSNHLSIDEIFLIQPFEYRTPKLEVFISDKLLTYK